MQLFILKIKAFFASNPGFQKSSESCRKCTQMDIGPFSSLYWPVNFNKNTRQPPRGIYIPSLSKAHMLHAKKNYNPFQYMSPLLLYCLSSSKSPLILPAEVDDKKSFQLFFLLFQVECIQTWHGLKLNMQKFFQTRFFSFLEHYLGIEPFSIPMGRFDIFVIDAL